MIRILFFTEDMAGTYFCELLSIKEPQTTLQIKKATAQRYRKKSNQKTKKRPVDPFLNVQGRQEWTILVSE